MTEAEVQSDLIKNFPFLVNQIRIQRKRRIFAAVALENFRKVFEYAAKKLGFSFLSAITGLDEGGNLAFMYHLSAQDGTILNIKTSAPREKPVLNTITDIFPAADIYERELMDLLGAEVKGLPQGKRYPLSDDWPLGEYPLRKDWKSKKQTENPKNA